MFIPFVFAQKYNNTLAFLEGCAEIGKALPFFSVTSELVSKGDTKSSQLEYPANIIKSR